MKSRRCFLKKKAIESSINEKIDKIVDYSDRLKNLSVFTPP